jgi:predicted nucleotidyltransferase
MKSPLHLIRTEILAIGAWARCERDIRAVAIVGSWARGSARSRSDIDFMFLTNRPRAHCRRRDWLARVAHRAGTRVRSRSTRRHGRVWSVHAQLATRRMLERTFAVRAWASVAPLDSGTAQVVDGGIAVLNDRHRLLHRLCREVFPR